MCKRNNQCKGFFFYDGYGKACTLYSTVEKQYFKNNPDSGEEGFCSHEKPKDRQEKFRHAKYYFLINHFETSSRSLIRLLGNDATYRPHARKNNFVLQI